MYRTNPTCLPPELLVSDHPQPSIAVLAHVVCVGLPSKVSLKHKIERKSKNASKWSNYALLVKSKYITHK